LDFEKNKTNNCNADFFNLMVEISRVDVYNIALNARQNSKAMPNSSFYFPIKASQATSKITYFYFYFAIEIFYTYSQLKFKPHHQLAQIMGHTLFNRWSFKRGSIHWQRHMKKFIFIL